MTHIDPGAPNGDRKGEGERAIPFSDAGDRSEDTSSNASDAASGAHSASGGSEDSRSETGTGGVSGSDEFLGVEKDFWLRLLFIVAAGFVAWVSFWFIIILAVAQIIYRLAAGHVNDDLRGFTRNMIRYEWDLLGFVALVRDERPFLFGGKFPDSKAEGP